MTNPNDPIGVNANATFIPRDMPEIWADQVKSLTYTSNGLTKREYFAGLAMQGIISDTNHDLSPHAEGEHYTAATARIACGYADALIAELSK